MDNLTNEIFSILDNLNNNNWGDISDQILSLEFIEKFKDKIMWGCLISNGQTFSEDFFKRYIKYILGGTRINYNYHSNCINLLIKNHRLSHDFIKEIQVYFDACSWDFISRYQNIIQSPLFIDEFKHNINWGQVFMYQKLSEEFIREHLNYVESDEGWRIISQNQILSETFIEEWSGKLDWNCISRNQKMSHQFIKKNINKINFNLLIGNKNYNTSDLLRYGLFMDLRQISDRDLGETIKTMKGAFKKKELLTDEQIESVLVMCKLFK